MELIIQMLEMWRRKEMRKRQSEIMRRVPREKQARKRIGTQMRREAKNQVEESRRIIRVIKATDSLASSHL